LHKRQAAPAISQIFYGFFNNKHCTQLCSCFQLCAVLFLTVDRAADSTPIRAAAAPPLELPPPLRENGTLIHLVKCFIQLRGLYL